MRAIVLASLLAAAGVMFLAGCSTEPKSAAAKVDLHTEVQRAIDQATRTDPGLQKFFDGSVGYAVFPEVGKGAAVVGGAFGRGELFQNGRMVGYCTLTQGTVGASLGGQKYSEFIFFENEDALNEFKSSRYTLAAQASAVALRSGASTNAKYANGVAVFTMGEAGLMVDASIGGQKFSFQPVSTQTQQTAGISQP